MISVSCACTHNVRKWPSAQQVNLVINFDLPAGQGGTANYIHRVGRSGRFGRKGTAINLLCGNADVAALRAIEQYYATQIDPLPEDLGSLM